MNDIREIVSKNLTKIRKQNNFTQQDLAKKINFSDNAISRWEKGEVLPSLETLQMLSLIYNVPINWFIEYHLDEELAIINRKQTNLNIAISSSIILTVWVFALIVFLLARFYTGKYYAIIFIWTLPATAFAIRFALKRFFKNKYYVLTASLCLWLTILCIYFQWYEYRIWPIFLFCVPLQLIFILTNAIKNLKNETINTKTKTKTK